MPAIRVTRDNVAITIESNHATIHQKPRSTMRRPTPGKNRIPTSRSRFMSSSKSQTATGPGATSL